MAYGTVWVDIISRRKRLPPKLKNNARKDIEREIRKRGLTYAKWHQSVQWRHDIRMWCWHFAADVAWDDAYEKTQITILPQPPAGGD